MHSLKNPSPLNSGFGDEDLKGILRALLSLKITQDQIAGLELGD